MRDFLWNISNLWKCVSSVLKSNWKNVRIWSTTINQGHSLVIGRPIDRRRRHYNGIVYDHGINKYVPPRRWSYRPCRNPFTVGDIRKLRLIFTYTNVKSSLGYAMQSIPIVKVPCTSPMVSVLLCRDTAMKLGSERLSKNRLYNKFPPVDWWLLLTSESIIERRVNPKPRTPSAP